MPIDSLIVVARGTPQAVDRDEIKRALLVLCDPAHGVQLLSAPSGKRVVYSGSEVGVLVEAAWRLADGISLYICTNPVTMPFDYAERAARVNDIVRRRWLMVDVDAVRADSHQPATDDEHEKAFRFACRVKEYLAEKDWPNPVVLDSGNGWHLLYRIDLANDLPSRTLCSNCLKALAMLFPNGDGEIDTATFKANQNTKLPGTFARKGTATKDRPHRMVRIIETPPDLTEIVPVEKLMQLASPLAKSPSLDDTQVPFVLDKPEAEDQTFVVTAPSSDGPHPWAQRRFEAQLAELLACGANSHQRHNQAIKSATAIGNYIVSGRLNKDVIEESLVRALINNDYPERDARRDVRDGLALGMSKPEQVPERQNGKKKQPEPVVPPAGKRIIRFASEIQPCSVEWLWPSRIPLKKLTTFAGQTGQGKTFVACEIMARITNGSKWPDGSTGWLGGGKVLFITGDDDFDDTIVPRLIEAGAKLENVVFLTEEDQADWTMQTLKTLTIAIEQAGGDVRLVVIDPPTSFLAGIDDHKNAELRGVLTPMKKWAKEHELAVILITHVNKGGASVDAMARVMGSVAWCTGVRAAYMFAADPDDETRQLLCALKTNIGPKIPTLAYRIINGERCGRVEWLGEVATTADEAVGGKSKPRKVVASDWLIECFRERLEWPSDELFRSAAACGISRNAVFEAKERLDLPRARQTILENGNRVWVWWVPKDWARFDNEPPKTEDQWLIH